MKKSVFMLLLMFAGGVQADAKSDAFNAGASYGKGSASQGTSALKNPADVTSAIPGYTSNPPEKSYYGGVSGGDGGLSDKGQAALGNSAAGQAVVDSSTKNPMTTIDPKAPFITVGKDAEAGSESVMDGSSQQCTEANVSKSRFDKYSCERDVWLENTCSRTGYATGSPGAPVEKTKVVTIPWSSFSISGTSFSVTIPETIQVTKAVLINTGNTPNYTTLGKTSGTFNGTEIVFDGTTEWDLNIVGTLTAGQVLSSTPFHGNRGGGGSLSDTILHGALVNGSKIVLSLVLNSTTWEQPFVPSVGWTENCAINQSEAVKTGSVCTSPGGERTVNYGGVDYTVHSDCWEYTDSYLVPANSNGTCDSLTSNPACTVNNTTCDKMNGSYCEHETVSYECQTVYSSVGLVCGGDYICQSGDCNETDGAGDSGFDTAVAKLAGLASAAEDVSNEQNQMNVRAFSGQAMSCRKAFAGFNNCCKDSGWGADAGLAACNSDEMAIGKAKAKKVTVSVGERCDHQVLGVCVQKSQVYCVFTGKLARIIQEQGRRDQLHVGFGSGDSPDCRGITVPELQGINFDLINFADFYEDLMNNQKIPDTATMTKLAKDRVAAQVNQMGGTTK